MSLGGSDSIVSRRTWLKRLLAGIAAARLLAETRLKSAAAGEVGDIPRDTGPLTIRVTRPFDAETPAREFVSFFTPNHRFFVRSHFGPPPERIAEAEWRLRIDGLVEAAKELTLGDIRQMEAVTVTAVLQCSGNGRAFYRPRIPGVQWERGAVGNAQWTGVRLRGILRQAGIRKNARHVQFQGADRPPVPSVPLFTRSIPLGKALHPDTLLAYEMNGRPLPLLHGAPLRVITPGWMADSCTKWLTDITLLSEESDGYYMRTAYRLPLDPIEPAMAGESDRTRPVEAMVVKSLIAAPPEGATVPLAPVMIQGAAWGGESKILSVEVSLDEGKNWQTARFVGEEHPYAWRQWQLVWTPRAPGPVSILCRATDETGTVQPLASPWNPGGFLWNGWDRVTVTVGG
ncbi:putative Sulfite:cytochrome c oxidoreductase, subunit A [Nitrospira japonica]|uniref:Putative Sulfite:cytochrome c oxidoreductase, subunit A n=1 Tax=Nitrospira japonica TaxID=1325564 RepID=A0A1W1I2N3_9BACT|nr:sulfite oxidase [Nitrospira japonica]SLM47267.1 putative Sulfite:cytochrome c oxidoreductase, subunit A [Nitrospira japonica]